jgi:hypothetical protein
MTRIILKAFWTFRLRWLESHIKEPFDQGLSLKIDMALIKVETYR